jgi:hypothetical protein
MSLPGQRPRLPEGLAAMQLALLQALASQRAAERLMAAVNGHQRPVLPSKRALMIRQRIGWALVQAGLRLVVEREGA